MTTAEFIFPQPSDSILDRKQEFRKVLWAFLAALLIHLLVAFGLAAFGGALTPAEAVGEETPMQMTGVDLPTPAPTRNTVFIENDESKQAWEERPLSFPSV